MIMESNKLTCIHPLHTTVQPPRQFTYPFFYEPHPLCVAAASEVQRHVEQSGIWHGEQSPGKMFGVLVVMQDDACADDGGNGDSSTSRLGFVAAYSGLLAGRNDWPYFVPPVYDAQQPDGHFKLTEREISDINSEIRSMETSYRYGVLKASLGRATAEAAEAVASMRRRVADAKAQRDRRRREAESEGRRLTDEENAEMIRESQFLKAELRRVRQQYDARLDLLRQPIDEHERQLASLRRRRREMSDELQTWLFRQYRVQNALGEERDLIDIFNDTVHAVPPAGSGDCCAPKLLQYAYAHGLTPVCMAEFWWGESPRQEIRHHMHYYPACRSKCLPILTFMLRGLDVEPNPLAQPKSSAQPRTVYEDGTIIVVDKPAGMLSVPGKAMDGAVNAGVSGAHVCDNVEDYVRRNMQQGQDATVSDKPLSVYVRAVHRLDMDTSGLLVLAKTAEAYVELQRQFASRETCKRYEAILDGVPAQREGRVCLPLIADIMDRPRQRVDYASGKYAVTDYRVLSSHDGKTLVSLCPHTGRTHQLRVHCAHRDGLGCPILGDPLYGRGTPFRRMCLHAAMIEFCHPVTGERMRFESASDFS